QKGAPSADLRALATELAAGVSAALLSFGRDMTMFGSTRLTKAPELDRLAALLDLASNSMAVGTSTLSMQLRADHQRADAPPQRIAEATAKEWDSLLGALPPYRADEPVEVTRQRLELAVNWIAVSTIVHRSDDELFNQVVGSLPLRASDVVID